MSIRFLAFPVLQVKTVLLLLIVWIWIWLIHYWRYRSQGTCGNGIAKNIRYRFGLGVRSEGVREGEEEIYRKWRISKQAALVFVSDADGWKGGGKETKRLLLTRLIIIHVANGVDPSTEKRRRWSKRVRFRHTLRDTFPPPPTCRPLSNPSRVKAIRKRRYSSSPLSPQTFNYSAAVAG